MEPSSEKQLAVKLFNDCWTLIEKENRSDLENAEMIHLAHASRFHWGIVGGKREWSIGEWQCSWVYSLVGNGEAALFHAKLSAHWCSDIPRPHFTHAAVKQAQAYAHYVLGDINRAQQLKLEALEELVGVGVDNATPIRKQIEDLPF